MCRELAGEHVPYLGELKAPHTSWSGALRHWLDGHVLCEEIKRYLNNFMAVTRVRPDDDNPGEVDNSDDLLEDEELELNAGNLAQALETRTASGTKADQTAGSTAGSAGQPEMSQAFELAKSIWCGDAPPPGAQREPPGLVMDEQHVDRILEKRAPRSARKQRACHSPALMARQLYEPLKGIPQQACADGWRVLARHAACLTHV